MPGIILKPAKTGIISSLVSVLTRNRHSAHPKVQFEEYLIHSDEPTGFSLPKVGLDKTGKSVEDSYFLRRKLRLNAEVNRGRQT